MTVKDIPKFSNLEQEMQDHNSAALTQMDLMPDPQKMTPTSYANFLETNIDQVQKDYAQEDKIYQSLLAATRKIEKGVDEDYQAIDGDVYTAKMLIENDS